MDLNNLWKGEEGFPSIYIRGKPKVVTINLPTVEGRDVSVLRESPPALRDSMEALCTHAAMSNGRGEI